MTQTADVAARESIFNIQCEAARLVVQRDTLPSGAALQYEAIDDSLIPCLKIRGPYRRDMGPDAGITLCAGDAGTRHKEPNSPSQYLDGFRTLLARARYARVGVYGIVRIFEASCGRMKEFTV